MPQVSGYEIIFKILKNKYFYFLFYLQVAIIIEESNMPKYTFQKEKPIE